MLAWFALLARACARFVSPFSGVVRPALRRAPARAWLPRGIARRPPRRRTIVA